MVKQEKITHINGKLYYKIFLAGANKILENQSLLNSINVFPVPDADTGTNLANTLTAVIDSAQPSHSFQLTADAIAIAALQGARGNSGVIFAQFLYGVSIETKGIEQLSIKGFARALKESINHIYNAVAEPVEGTILTVIREWAEYIYSQKDIIDDFAKLFLDAYQIAIKTLANTTEQIKSLKLANVVDAGAKGFVLFLEGIQEGFRKKSSKRAIIVHTQKILATNIKSKSHTNFNFRYCSEALIKGVKIDHYLLKKKIRKFGDSLVIAGSNEMLRIHMHTNEPHLLFEKLHEFGSLTYQKVDDMLRQKQISEERKWKIALVTDSTSDLPMDILDKYQINIIPLNLHFGENQYLDKMTLRPEQFFDMMQKSKHFPSTSQPNESSFYKLYSELAVQYDSVISVHLTQKFSGTYFNALKAAKKVSSESGKQISVLDSKHVSGSLGLLTLRIAEGIENGMDHDRIVNEFVSWRDKSRIFVSVKNINNMIKGGRVNPVKGLMVRTLNIKPIVSMDIDGNSLLFDKAFSQKSNMKKVMKHIEKFLEDKKIWHYEVLHAEGEDAARWFIDEMKKLTGKKPLSVMNISPVIGLSAGKGTAAIALIAE